jgi:hypothetical protein
VVALLSLAGCRHVSVPSAIDAAAETADSKPQPSAALDPEIRWLQEHSMLARAAELSASLSGSGAQWQEPYGAARPHDFLALASVWFTDVVRLSDSPHSPEKPIRPERQACE